MKNDFYFYRAFVEACLIEGIAPSVWMNKNGFSSSTATAMKNGSRPSLDTLKAATSNWFDRESGLRVLEAYIKDEIERCGYSLDEIAPVIDRKVVLSESESPTLDADLQTVQQFMNKRPIRDSIHAMAVLLKRSAWAEEDEMKRKRKIRAQVEADAAAHKNTSSNRRSNKSSLAKK